MNENTTSALIHALSLVTGFIAPLIAYIVADNETVKENARNALNWQISLTVYLIISGILTIVIVGFLTAAVLAFLDLIFCIKAAMKASGGETWSYPLTVDLL